MAVDGKPGTGLDGTSGPIPATEIWDETSTTTRPCMLVLAWEIQFLFDCELGETWFSDGRRLRRRPFCAALHYNH